MTDDASVQRILNLEYRIQQKLTRIKHETESLLRLQKALVLEVSGKNTDLQPPEPTTIELMRTPEDTPEFSDQTMTRWYWHYTSYSSCAIPRAYKHDNHDNTVPLFEFKHTSFYGPWE
jgi:hypothetical protein